MQTSAQWTLKYSLLAKTSNNIIICTLNTCSLLLCAHEIAHDHDLHTATVLYLQETWINNTDHLPQLNEMYNLYPSLSIHGLLTCCAKHCSLQNIQTFATDHLESIIVDIIYMSSTFRIANLYLIPNAPINHLFNAIETITTTLTKQTKLIIVGDFNIDMLKQTK